MNNNLKIFELIKTSINNLKVNLKEILGFEIIYKILTLLLIRPGINLIFWFLMEIGGYDSLLNMDIKNFVLSIVGILTIFIIAVISSVAIYFEFSTLLILLNSGHNDEKVSLSYAMHRGGKKVKDLRGERVFGLFLYLIVLIPVINIGLSSALIPKLEIPNFVIGEIEKYTGGIILIGLFTLFLLTVYSKLSLILPIMVLEGESFKEALEKSKELNSGQSFKLSFIFLGFSLILSFISSMHLWSAPLFRFLPENIYNLLFFVLRFISIIFSFTISPLMLSAILSIYKRHEKDLDLEHMNLIKERESFEKESQVLKGKIIANIKKYWYIYGVLIIGIVILSLPPNDSNYKFNETMVIGHRGSLEGVENTVEAVSYAGEVGAEYAEIDVLLSKDNVPMVIHDTNLYRLTGEREMIYDLTAEELEEFVLNDGRYSGQILPLEDFYKEIDGKVKLLIEFKTHGKEEKSIVEETMKIMNELDKKNETKYQTSEVKLLIEFKENYSNQEIGYIIIGKLGRLPSKAISNLPADFLAFEESLITKRLVKACHSVDKPIYAWTVNDKEGAEKLIELKVDGIITDYPKNVVDLINK